MNEQRSTFQTAIAVVEALPVEEQTMLVEMIDNRHFNRKAIVIL